MMKMLTLFGKDIKELRFNELKRERKCQKRLLSHMKKLIHEEEKEYTRHQSQIREDKIKFYKIYQEHLQALVDEIDYYMDRRAEPVSNYDQGNKSKKSIREENRAKARRVSIEGGAQSNWMRDFDRDGLGTMWDRERFLLIAEDRGYFTEEAVMSAMAKELNLDMTRARLILNSGRLTWGQVLTLGAFFEMTPKEFCDTFLAGYFIDSFGEFRASPDNIRKDLLLRRVVRGTKPKLEDAPYEEIFVGSEGDPYGADEYFDENGNPISASEWFGD